MPCRRHVLTSAAALLAGAGLAGTAHAVTIAGHRSPPVAHGMPISRVPSAQTGSASGVTATAATLHGEVTSSTAQADYGFQYGTTTAYGQWAPAGSGPNVSLGEEGMHSVEETVTGLTPGTTYHFRVVLAQPAGQGNVWDEIDGGDVTFTTLPAPPTSSTTSATTTTATPTTSTTSTTTTSATATSSTTPQPSPIVSQTAVAGTVAGSVSVTLPGTTTPQPLGAGAGASIPLGAVVDARRGVVKVTNAIAGGATQSATVWDGRFTMTQSRSGRTTFHLIGAPACPSGRPAHSARGRAPVQLWAHDHHGRYSTRGQNSVATVRGTVWETIESCAGTRTVVRRGVVSVRDLRTHRSVLVHAGHSVLVPR